MAFLQVKSDNPKFSFILRKNPASGMFVKTQRLGRAFGWYSDDQTYNIYFKDADNEVSYKAHTNEDFEYLNTTRYSSSLFVLNAFSEFFNSAVKKIDPEDKLGFNHVVLINMMHIANLKYVAIFNQYFKGFNIAATELAKDNHRITITTQRPLIDLFNFVNLFSMFNALKNDSDYVDVSENTVQKYLTSLLLLDAPYFLRYVFKVNFLRSPKLFEQFLDQLQKTDSYKLDLTFGSNATNRRDVITSKLIMDMDIVDLGCGEGFYAFQLVKKIPETSLYHAIDKDEELREKIQHKAKVKQLDNLKTHSGYFAFKDQNENRPYRCIMAEVVEHMELAEAESLIYAVMTDPNCKQLLISTPNKRFNKFYDFDSEEMRHDDHKFELNEDEFKAWIKSIIRGSSWDIEFFDLGDKVDDITTTCAVNLVRK